MIYRTETDGEMERDADKRREVKRGREKGRTVIAQGRLDLNSCKYALSGEEKQEGFQLGSLNCFSRSHTKDPNSTNSSESFHSIGGQLPLTELTP